MKDKSLLAGGSTISKRAGQPIYKRSECVILYKAKEEPYGCLINMAGGYPLRANGIMIYTSEALYQACRFPDFPDIQREILGERSGMGPKMKSKKEGRRRLLKEGGKTRNDWEAVREPIMRWVLCVKLACNYRIISVLLLQARDHRSIVEFNPRDTVWGTKEAQDPQFLEGGNKMGLLWMEIRETVKNHPESLQVISPPPIENFLLLGNPVEIVQRP
jgi:ribA/ribD-fused uncharacterized protein